MARSCGLRIGPRRFEIVVLDGSPKKHKILTAFSGEFPRAVGELAGADPDELAEGALRDALKANNVPRENAALAIDSGRAAFRMLKMPFSDRAKIEQVLKFEVESLLPQWNIDEVVVDFHVLDSTDEASELLVTGVQKSEVRKAISLCERAGIEPLEAELETTAMVNAALAANVSSIDSAQLLVHVSEHSTSVVVIDGGKTREMRAIHIGALSHEIVQAPAAETEEGEKKEEGKDAPAPATGTWLDAPPDPDELQRRLEQTIKRIRRELGRTISATRTAHPIQAIYVCGLDVPGLVDSQILDLPVRRLELPVEGVPAGADASRFVIAYGAALRQIGGGVLKPSLRREELRYTGAFERLELPLAVVCLLLVTLGFVWNIFLRKEREVVEAQLADWREQSIEKLMGDPKQGVPPELKYPPDKVKTLIKEFDSDEELTKFQQVKDVKTAIDTEVKKLEKDLGQDAEVVQPQSALMAMVLVLDVLEHVTSDDARPSIRRVRATYQNGRQQKPDKVRLAIDFSIFAESQLGATQMLDRFLNELNSKPWIASQAEPRHADALDNGKGIYIENQIIEVDATKAPRREAPKAAQ